MTRRSAMTLVEVLVAIFIMAIGLIALLTLFPIGMLRMAQAIRDARSAQSGQNAHALSIMQDIRNDPLVKSDNGAGDSFKNPMPGTLPDADPYGESYSILVDPIAYTATAGLSSQFWVTGNSPVFGGYLCRRTVGFTGGVPLNIYKNFTLWDDVAFDGFNIPGTPQVTLAGVVKRDTRFSWAYLLRRPQTGDASIVDCSVVVFDQRGLSLTGNLSLEEYLYPNAVFNTANSPFPNTVTIDYSAAGQIAPSVRPGDWILDNTFYQKVKGGPASANAYFYRVVGIEQLPGQVARYELQNPIRGYLATPSAVGKTWSPNVMANGYTGTVMVIRGIAEVFDKGPVRLP